MNRLEEVKNLLAKSNLAIAAKEQEIKSVLAVALGPNITHAALAKVIDAQIEGWAEREGPNGDSSQTAIDGLLREHHLLRKEHTALLAEFGTIREEQPFAATTPLS